MAAAGFNCSSLTSLPEELLLEIMKYVDFDTRTIVLACVHSTLGRIRQDKELNRALSCPQHWTRSRLRDALTLSWVADAIYCLRHLYLDVTNSFQVFLGRLHDAGCCLPRVTLLHVNAVDEPTHSSDMTHALQQVFPALASIQVDVLVESASVLAALLSCELQLRLCVTSGALLADKLLCFSLAHQRHLRVLFSFHDVERVAVNVRHALRCLDGDLRRYSAHREVLMCLAARLRFLQLPTGDQQVVTALSRHPMLEEMEVLLHDHALTDLEQNSVLDAFVDSLLDSESSKVKIRKLSLIGTNSLRSNVLQVPFPIFTSLTKLNLQQLSIRVDEIKLILKNAWLLRISVVDCSLDKEGFKPGLSENQPEEENTECFGTVDIIGTQHIDVFRLAAAFQSEGYPTRKLTSYASNAWLCQMCGSIVCEHSLLPTSNTLPPVQQIKLLSLCAQLTDLCLHVRSLFELRELRCCLAMCVNLQRLEIALGACLATSEAEGCLRDFLRELLEQPLLTELLLRTTEQYTALLQMLQTPALHDVWESAGVIYVRFPPRGVRHTLAKSEEPRQNKRKRKWRSLKFRDSSGQLAFSFRK